MSGAVEKLRFTYLWNRYHQQIPGIKMIQIGAISLLLCQHQPLFHCWKHIWCWKLPCRVATSENDRLHIYSLCIKFIPYYRLLNHYSDSTWDAQIQWLCGCTFSKTDHDFFFANLQDGSVFVQSFGHQWVATWSMGKKKRTVFCSSRRWKVGVFSLVLLLIFSASVLPCQRARSVDNNNLLVSCLIYPLEMKSQFGERKGKDRRGS